MDNSTIRPPISLGALIDPQAIETLRSLRIEGEPDPLPELVELFLADTPNRIAQIHTALCNSAAHDLEAAAHSLKGSASNLGATTIAAACGRIMQHARKNEFAPAAALLEAIESDFPQVRQKLLAELSR